VAAPSGSEEEQEDPRREAKGYNQSIYLMVATPYLLLGGVGFLIYRSVKSGRKSASAQDDNPAQ
jgi:hypothetical protein